MSSFETLNFFGEMENPKTFGKPLFFILNIFRTYKKIGHFSKVRGGAAYRQLGKSYKKNGDVWGERGGREILRGLHNVN